MRGAGPGLLEGTKELLVNKETDEAAQWITEKTGQFLPLDLQFVDEAGKLGFVMDGNTGGIQVPGQFGGPLDHIGAGSAR